MSLFWPNYSLLGSDSLISDFPVVSRTNHGTVMARVVLKHSFEDESIASQVVDQLNNLNCGAEVALEHHNRTQTEVSWQPKPIAEAILQSLQAEAAAAKGGEGPQPTIKDVIYFTSPYGGKFIDQRFVQRVENVTTKPFYVVTVVLKDHEIKHQHKVEKILYQSKASNRLESGKTDKAITAA